MNKGTGIMACFHKYEAYWYLDFSTSKKGFFLKFMHLTLLWKCCSGSGILHSAPFPKLGPMHGFRGKANWKLQTLHFSTPNNSVIRLICLINIVFVDVKYMFIVLLLKVVKFAQNLMKIQLNFKPTFFFIFINLTNCLMYSQSIIFIFIYVGALYLN